MASEWLFGFVGAIEFYLGISQSDLWAFRDFAPSVQGLLVARTLEDVNSLGIDQVGTEAGVAKATFYKHFSLKDDLVVAYLEEIDRLGRAAVAALPQQPPREMIAAIMGRISEAVVAGGWRGCPFLNAAAEYSDPASPVRQVINARRVWYHDSLEKLLAADGDPAPSVTASLLVAVSDGLLESAYLDGPEKFQPTSGKR